jgi:hypothetical protein
MDRYDDIPDDLLDAVHALEEHRPRMTEPELARIKRRVAGGASAPITRPTGGFMRSRLAITALLATGALMSSGGAALGVSALSTDLSASSAQYGTPTGQVASSGAAGTNSGTGAGAGTEAAGPRDEAEVLGAGADAPSAKDNGGSGVAAATATAQAPRQVAASEADTLPFTGYAAIPLLLMGLVLLATGLALRRSTTRTPDQA